MIGVRPRVGAGTPRRVGCSGLNGSMVKRERVAEPGLTVKRYWGVGVSGSIPISSVGLRALSKGERVKGKCVRCRILAHHLD